MFRSHEHQAGRMEAWETLIACTSLEQGRTAPERAAIFQKPWLTCVRWLLVFAGLALAVGIYPSKVLA